MQAHTPSASPAVFSLIARLADNKYFLGRRYAEWCSAAPELESGVAAAAMAQDELGHARAIYPLLRDLAPASADPAEIDPDTRTHFLNMAALDEPFAGWPDFVAANFLIDTALSLVFEAGLASSFEPLAARGRKVLQEERVHAEHGDAWVRRLGRSTPAVRSAIEVALLRVWDETLCWFGPPDAPGDLAEQRVLDGTPDQLRARFLAIVGPAILATDLGLPLRRAAEGHAWELTAPLPWREWDPATYRLAGAYAVERTGPARAQGAGREVPAQRPAPAGRIDPVGASGGRPQSGAGARPSRRSRAGGQAPNGGGQP